MAGTGCTHDLDSARPALMAYLSLVHQRRYSDSSEMGIEHTPTPDHAATATPAE